MTLRLTTGSPMPARPVVKPAAAPLDRAHMTTLQRHVDFFDGNKDGQVTVGETQAALKTLGMGTLKAKLAGLVINLGLASKTASGSKTVIDVATIKSAMHDSDSGNLDKQGNFVQTNFDATFARYDTNKSGTWDEAEVAAMVAERKQTKLGSFASKQEWGQLMSVAADGTETVAGKQVKSLSKTRVQGMYDGMLFPQLAAARAAKQAP